MGWRKYPHGIVENIVKLEVCIVHVNFGLFVYTMFLFDASCNIVSIMSYLTFFFAVLSSLGSTVWWYHEGELL